MLARAALRLLRPHYDKLRGPSGIQWPCTDDAPDGTERLYADGAFNTDPDYAETFGQDLTTGASHSEAASTGRRRRDGRAFLTPRDLRAVARGADAERPAPADDRPHPLPLPHPHQDRPGAGADAAAPDAWVELSAATPSGSAIADGDPVAVESARGEIEVPARVNGIRPGVVFIPFHYGYWDRGRPGRRPPGAPRTSSR